METGFRRLTVLVLVVITAGILGMDEPACREEAGREVVVAGNNKFAVELYANLRGGEGNLFFSPYSISTALAMAYGGSRGETEAQMAEVLGFGAAEKEGFHKQFGAIIDDLNTRGAKGGYELNVANALWGQRGYKFLEEFLALVEENYGGGLSEVDFVNATESARRTINRWVEEKTKEKIKELIKRGVLDKMTRLVLTNAIYFKGDWARQFKEDRTKEAPFALESGSKTEVLMMNETAEFGYMETEGFQVLELPYVDEELSMIVFLPREAGGLGDFEKEFTIENLSGWLGRIRKQKVIVSVPKFKLTSGFELGSILASMGMESAFSGTADFSGMTGKRDLFISNVIHKAYVDVNEEGTEAAAATGVAMRMTSAGPGQMPVFRADRPFLFLIRDNHSGGILFMGRLMNPKKDGK